MKAGFAIAALMMPTVALAITPATTGTAGGTTITINASSGDQTDPHVSGNLAVYTNNSGSTSTIRYYNFLSAADLAIPNAGELDLLSDVNGNKVAFSRVRSDGTTASMVFDVSTMSLTDVAPVSGSNRFGVVLGSSVVAFQELNSGNGDIFVYDLSTSGPLINLSASSDMDQNASIAPAGNAVVWERCVGSNCDIVRSVKSGGSWTAAEVVSATLNAEGNPDTDGTTVVYDSNRPSATDQDIYFQPLMGGTETALQLAGIQRNPSINSGVIAFESKADALANADIYVYIVAANQLLQVTNTASIDESLNDVTVLGNGDIRLVWAANDDAVASNHNIYARTFTPPSTSTGGGCDQDKVAVCHIPPGHPSNKHTIYVGQSAVPAHLAHGDYLGPCNDTGSSGQHLDNEPQPQTGCSTAGGLAPMVAGLMLLAMLLRRRPVEVRARRK